MNSSDRIATQPSRRAAAAAARKRHPRPRPGHPRIRTATMFVPVSPGETPEHHFPLQTVFTRTPRPRFVNRYDSREMLLVVDGSCVNQGCKGRLPAGGCSFTYKGSSRGGGGGGVTESGGAPSSGGRVGFPLEEEDEEDEEGGPGSGPGPTSNRAKLRAVIAALQHRAWQEEGWRRIVVATNLQYVAFGATMWLPVWVRRRWRTRKCKQVANRDLWEELSGIIESLARLGTEVSFWLLPPHLAKQGASPLVCDTKEVAREAASMRYDAVMAEFRRLCGIEI
ncbi:hypothetical protein F4775DRAFT_458724 [Biscogniauxia sp. FL1348]|nr:hypothetical protein F4775DRAFT_458724 [Biscogniauxia sp. FL1348]